MTVPAAGAGDRIRVGDFEVVRLLDGTFLVDGGAMFGVVPRTLWEQRVKPDRENRISLALSCYLIRGPGITILVETGIGPDVDRRYADFYGVRREPGLLPLLREEGLEPGDIDIVFNSHLHFDHCGGNTVRDGAGGWAPGFPRARYAVQAGEWRNALRPVERDKPSYIPARLAGLGTSGRLLLLEGTGPVAEGVDAVLMPGHTAFHQGLKLTSGGATFLYFGDLVPTSAHIDLPYIMSYDLYPVETLETKKRFYEPAAAEGWTVAFSHDAGHAFGTLVKHGRRCVFSPRTA